MNRLVRIMTRAAVHRLLSNQILLFLLALLILCTVCGCPSGDQNDSESTDSDTVPFEDAGSEEDTDVPKAKWIIEKVEEKNVGLQSELAIGPDGIVAIAYWASESYDDGTCDEIEVNPPIRLRQELYFAQKPQDSLEWSVEVVDEPVVVLSPTGLNLAYDPQGRPAIAYTGGEPQDQYCGGNDAVFALRDEQGWSFDTAGAESGDSQTGNPASDSGFVVGLWPALAFDLQGEPAILHKDAHFGSLQRDDKYRADAEFAWHSGGTWTHEAVDPGEAAGDHNELIFDPEGRPVAFYAITVEAQGVSRHGVWAARRESDGSWSRVQLHKGAIHREISAAIDPVSREVVAAFYSAKDYAVRIRRLKDSERFAESDAWDSELVGDSRYDEGMNVSLAFTPSGQTALAYHRCKMMTATSEGCDQNDEAAIFAHKKTNGWKIEVVKEATRGSCGEYTSLGFDRTGNAYIAYRCTEETHEGFSFRLFVASKNIGDTN